jgi:hypothetical protein
MSALCREAPWRDWHEANATRLSSYCEARGRYELAHELHSIGTDRYEREIVNKANPLHFTTDDLKRFRQFLEEYKTRLDEFPLLLATRSRLLEILNGHTEGIDRDKLKTILKHDGSTAFGVICNQLARGGWLRQEKNGKKYRIYPATSAPPSDELFVSAELCPPEETNQPLPPETKPEPPTNRPPWIGPNGELLDDDGNVIYWKGKPLMAADYELV